MWKGGPSRSSCHHFRLSGGSGGSRGSRGSGDVFQKRVFSSYLQYFRAREVLSRDVFLTFFDPSHTECLLLDHNLENSPWGHWGPPWGHPWGHLWGHLWGHPRGPVFEELFFSIFGVAMAPFPGSTTATRISRQCGSGPGGQEIQDSMRRLKKNGPRDTETTGQSPKIREKGEFLTDLGIDRLHPELKIDFLGLGTPKTG